MDTYSVLWLLLSSSSRHSLHASRKRGTPLPHFRRTLGEDEGPHVCNATIIAIDRARPTWTYLSSESVAYVTRRVRPNALRQDWLCLQVDYGEGFGLDCTHCPLTDILAQPNVIVERFYCVLHVIMSER